MSPNENNEITALMNEVAVATRKTALYELNNLRRNWTDSPRKDKYKLNVRDMCGHGISFLPERHVSISELDEIIQEMEIMVEEDEVISEEYIGSQKG